MDPEDSKQEASKPPEPPEPTEPTEPTQPTEPTAIPPSRSVRSVYVAPSATQTPAAKPSVAKPPTATPSVAKPPAAAPSVVKPPAAAPSVVKPPAAAPSVVKPPAAAPSVVKPPAAAPSVAKTPTAKSRAPSAPKPSAPKGPKDAVSVPGKHLQPLQAEPPKGPRKPQEPPGLPKTAPQQEPATRPVPSSEKAKAAIQKRAEGRSKVPDTFRDSLKYFCFSPTGLLKILRMIIIIAAVVCFVSGQAHETFIVITIQEASIVLFFIIIYMVTLQHLLVTLHWPLFDLINSFISAVFLLVVAVLTWQEKERRQLFYIGGVLCLTAAIVCFIDASVVTKKMRNNESIPGIKTVPLPAQEPKHKPL